MADFSLSTVSSVCTRLLKEAIAAVTTLIEALPADKNAFENDFAEYLHSMEVLLKQAEKAYTQPLLPKL